MSDGEINVPNISELTIYEGGALNKIKTSDLLNNEIAIKQLINRHNLKIQEVHNAQGKISELNSEVEYHRTSPFFSGIALIINVIGTTIVAIGVNLLTSTPSPNYSGAILGLGITLVVVGSLIPITYPYARGYFNPRKEKK